MDWVMRLVHRWYDPHAQELREQRTTAATERASATARKLDEQLPRIEHLRQSYAKAGKRLSSGRTR